MKNIILLNKILFSFLLLFLTKEVSSQKYLKMPLNIVSFPNEQELSSITTENLLIKLSKTRLQTEITIGSNKQKLPTDISFEHYNVYVSSILCEENIIKFNQDSSSSFFNYGKIDGLNLNQNCLKCNTSKDYFYFNNINNNEQSNNGVPITFILGYMLQTQFNSISAEIGFRPTKSKSDPSVVNFIVQLKKANIITNKNFMFHLNPKEKKGDLLLGAYNEKFYHNFDKFKYFYVSADSGNIEYWEFLLDNAYYGKKYICEKNKVVISLNQYFIYPPFYMKKILDEDFFKEFYVNKKCELINLNKTSTYFYVCDDTIDINKMRNFYFFPYNLNEPIEFILSPKDLFLKFGKNKLLYIMGFNYDFDYWHFNLPFIMKFQPIFDIENKIIAFYNDLDLFNESDFTNNENANSKSDINNNNEKNEKGSGYYAKVVFIIILLIFLIITIFIVVRKALFKNYNKNKQEESRESQLLEFQDLSKENNEGKKDNKNEIENKLNV